LSILDGGAADDSASFYPCLRVLILLPIKYDPRDAITPNQDIEAEKFIDVQLLLTGRYDGITILQPYEPPFVEGWWQSGGTIYPPEHNRLIDIVTRSLPEQAARQAEKDWLLKEMYLFIRREFRQDDIFLLVQEVERARLTNGSR